MIHRKIPTCAPHCAFTLLTHTQAAQVRQAGGVSCQASRRTGLSHPLHLPVFMAYSHTGEVLTPRNTALLCQRDRSRSWPAHGLHVSSAGSVELLLPAGAALSPASRTERKQGTVKEAALGANEKLGQRVLKHEEIRATLCSQLACRSCTTVKPGPSGCIPARHRTLRCLRARLSLSSASNPGTCRVLPQPASRDRPGSWTRGILWVPAEQISRGKVECRKFQSFRNSCSADRRV